MAKLNLILIALALLGQVCGAPQLIIKVDQPGRRIPSSFYGMMTEEVSHSYDGGLYAELVQNRFLQDNTAKPLEHWSLIDGEGATLNLDTSQPVPDTALTNSLRLDATKPGTGVANDGFWGVPLKPNTLYHVSFYAKANANFTGSLAAAIESNDGKVVSPEMTQSKITSEWQKYSGTIQTGAVVPSMNNRFIIRAKGSSGTLWLAGVSLFPPTYHDRANGNRIDLMEKMAAMKPSFLRLPGGNYLDPGHYEWKKAIGPRDQRTGHPGAWNYRSSDGLGMLEFLDWCEDLKIEPVLGVTDGRDWLPADGNVAPLIQDALDEIEFITGDAKTTQWGAIRAANGHLEPMPLHYVEIGNEDFFDKPETYNARFARFFDAIRAKYPQLQIIATRDDVSSRKPDLVDDHYYRKAVEMVDASTHYDSYDRNGPKIFVGEWASIEGSPTPTLQAALGDAVWLTGLERNSDVVIMEAYAPLLVNVNPGARQWDTNLIGYDALHSYGSPSYWMQVMFAENTGDVQLPVEVNGNDEQVVPQGAIGVGTYDTQAEFDEIKVIGVKGEKLYPRAGNSDCDFLSKEGIWQAKNNTFIQRGNAKPAQMILGDATWNNYTLTLRARKNGGSEGFIIPFLVQDENNFLWWNIGGWGNSRTVIEQTQDGRRREIGDSVPFTVETGRWYDIKIQINGREVRTYFDGKLVNAAHIESNSMIYTAASLDTSTRDVMLKAVNFSSQSRLLQIHLQGDAEGNMVAVGKELTGAPNDVNSIEDPEKLAPKLLRLNRNGTAFEHEFPAYSITVLKFKSKSE